MNAAQLTIALGFAQTLGGGSASGATHESGWTCSEYPLMLDAEVELGADCSTEDKGT